MPRKLPEFRVELMDGSSRIYTDCDYFTAEPSQGLPPNGQAILMSRDELTMRVIFGVRLVEVVKRSAAAEADEVEDDADSATG